ncbi:Polyhomeotic-like protein 3 [Araneus ventricosus]|uniref:Polyhomeotic-like protein 3 n=1 Tax=Araneus ventricosus TaxID=182803 RepID=A0A4Y2HBR3_ARAVE|nr:Polyhomeotic-like protein 3 [Araneus ventricosus]
MHPVHYSQASTANAGTMMTTAGQVIATSTGNFPQQILPGLVPTNANKIVIFGQCEAAATQQSLSNFRPKVVARSQKEKTHTFQNQLPVLQPNSLYGSIVPVHSSSQILNGYHIREISSQPQIITTQASGTVLNQAQLLGLQTVNALPPGLTWAPSGLHHCQNPFIIYNQPPGMTVHQIQPQMAMHLPGAAAALPIPTATSAVVAPRMQKYPQLMPKVKIVEGPSYIGQHNQLPSSPVAQLKSVAGNQTNPNLVYIVNDQTKSTGKEGKSVSVETKISSPQRSQVTDVPFSEILQASLAPVQKVDVSVKSMTPSTLTIESCAGENPSPSNTEMVTINAEINQAPSTSVALSDTGIETYVNPVQVVNDLTKYTGVENKTVSVETKISSPQKSQASITPFSKIPQACIASTVNVSVTPSTLTTGSSTDVSPSPSSIQRATTHAEMNREPSTPVTQQNSDACNEICSNPVQSVGVLAKSTGNESMSVSAETNISSHQKSQAMVIPFSKFLQACVVPTPTVDVSVESSAMSSMTTSSVVSTFSVPTVSPVSPVPCLTNRVLSDFNSEPSLPKAYNKAVVTSHQTNTTETMVTDESLKPQQLIQELSFEPVKDKQPLTAAVKPQVLTHIINGFIIQESSEPFPVSQSPLLDSSYRVFPHKNLNLPEERENSPTVPNPENKVRALRPRGGRGRKRKRFRGRKRLQKQLLVEDESPNATPAEEILPASENELVVSYKTDEENSVPFDNSHHTPMEVDKSSDEVELLKSDLSQKSPSKWTVQDVFEFIQNLPGYSDYADNFKSQEVDGQALLLLNEDHLKTAMCMKLGPAIKLLSQIRSIEEKLQL